MGINNRKILTLFITVILIISIYILSIVFASLNLYSYDKGEALIIAQDTIQELRENDHLPNENLRYVLFDSFGVATKSNIDEISPNEDRDLKYIISLSNSINKGYFVFVTPIVYENNDGESVQDGIALVAIPEEFLAHTNPIAIMVISLGTLILIAILIIIFKENYRYYCDVYKPILMIKTFSKNLSNGVYDERLTYDFVDEIGEVCHNLEYLRDELKNARNIEESYKKNEKYLLACISHDLKTPLQIIMAITESIQDNMLDKAVGCERIIEKLDYLNNLVDDILIQSKVDTEKLQIKKQECYSQKYFELELATISQMVYNSNKIIMIGKVPNVLINIDKKRISQVLSNLVSNSIKYTGDDGKINIDFELENGELIISVLDNGIGINTEDFPFIFDKYYRGKSPNTQYNGSGLGLSIVKYIIEQHDGKIDCTTEIGKYTDFKFSLRVA